MFEEFKRYLLTKGQFTTANLARIKAISRMVNVNKGDLILKTDDIWHYNAFVSSGLFRTYWIDNMGGEHIISFAHRNYWVGDRESLLSGRPTLLNIQALEDSALVMIDQKDFHSLSKEIEPFNQMMVNLIQANIAFTKGRISANMSVSDLDKYKNFIKKFEAVAGRIPHHMIASYLQMDPATLTRIIESRKK